MTLTSREIQRVHSHSWREAWLRRVVIDDGCWEWIGRHDSNGYGTYRLGARNQPRKAHRIGYELFVGPIPHGLTLDHLCMNKGCVRPSHLEAVTHLENVRRARVVYGPRTHCRQGHEFTPANTATYHPKDRYSYRKCRTCVAAQNAARAARKAVAA
jgi:hypothetical protein